MANYYSQGVITVPVFLNEDLYVTLTHRGADLEDAGQKETALDGIVHERPPLGLFTVAFPVGWRCTPDDADEFFVETCDLDDDEIEALSAEVRRLVVLPEPHLMLEILKVNPELEFLAYREANTCSRMRLDGFGGGSVTVTRKGWLETGSHSVKVTDGVVEVTSKFQEW